MHGSLSEKRSRERVLVHDVRILIIPQAPSQQNYQGNNKGRGME